MVYDRMDHLKQAIHALQSSERAQDTVLYISSDAAFHPGHTKKIFDVRNFIFQIRGFKEIIPIIHNTNKGLAEAYNESINLLFERFDRFIFLEDDVVVSPDFLNFMNEGLSYYENDPNVLSISGFSHSAFFEFEEDKKNKIYFTNRWNPWGFGTWKKKFLNIPRYSLNDLKKDLKRKSFVKKLDSIGIDLYPVFKQRLSSGEMLTLDYYYVYHMVKNELVTVTPYVTKTFNIGNDGSGTRTKANEKFTSFDLSKLKRNNTYQFVPYSPDFVNNSFNERINGTKTSKIKRLLDNLGLLSLAYYLHETRKKWIRKKKARS